MDNIISIINTIGGKISISLGGLGLLIFGIFKINNGADERIDKRSQRQVNKAIMAHREWCTVEMKHCIEDSPKLASLEANVENIKDTVNKIWDIQLKAKR